MTTSRFRRFIAPVLSVAFVLSCVASPSLADAPQWKVDASKSRLGFSGTQTGAKFEGKFSRYDANIVFDPDQLDVSRITVTIDLASAATGDKQRDTALPTKDWFDVGAFPQAKFSATTIKKIGDGAYEAAGELSLRGTTKPLILPFTLKIDGNTAHAVAHVSLTRTTFGVGQGAWSSGQWVALKVGIDLDIVATR